MQRDGAQFKYRIRKQVVLLATIAMVGYLTLTASPANATTVTFSSTVSVPAPPSSNFAGAGGGGDGWAVALSSTQIFNVFHHNPTMGVMCHNQTDASACWSGYKTIQDSNNSNSDFGTPGHPGVYYQESTGHLLTMAVRQSDKTAGVVCIDTTQPAGVANPFCGFTALTAANEGTTSPVTSLTNPVMIGTKWYSMNVASGSATGAKNAILCYDLQANTPCAGQPYAINYGGASVTTGFPSPPSAAMGNKIIYQVNAGGIKLACFDTQTNASCTGSWPISTSGSAGAPFPMLDANGAVVGVCQPYTSVPCWDTNGGSVTTPAALSTAVSPTSAWNGEAVTIGARVYIPDGGNNQVACYDFSTNAACTNFPHAFTGLSLLYTVNRDPQRPTCLWVNADSGASQIQNFDAYTGGSCGTAPSRVASANIISTQCLPLAFSSIKVVNPPPSSYTSGAVDFTDNNGNAIAGFNTHPLDANGIADVSDLNLSTNSLPQFAIALTGQSGTPGSVDVQLSWTGTYSPSCVSGGNTVVNATAPGSPGNVTVTGASTSAVVAWSTPGSDGFSPLTGYTVTAKDGNGAAAGTCSATPPATTCTVTGLTDGTAYSFEVKAANAIGNSAATVQSGYAGTAPPPTTTTTTPPAATPPATPLVPTGGSTASTPSGSGYWSLTPGGTLSTHGDAADLGSQNGKKLNAPIVAINSTTTGDGYWLAGSDGGVFTFGDAKFFGSAASTKLNQPVVAIGRTPDNNGYWLTGSDGGVFCYGNAGFYGSLGSQKLNQPIVAIVPTPSGSGYWLAGADGGVFTFGDAQFFGSLGSSKVNKHIVGIAATPDGGGYWLVAADGGVFAFGNAKFFGSLGADGKTPIVGMIANGNVGYRLIEPDGTAHPFGTVS